MQHLINNKSAIKREKNALAKEKIEKILHPRIIIEVIKKSMRKSLSRSWK